MSGQPAPAPPSAATATVPAGPRRVGVLGGGQLGRMLGLAGVAMGLEFSFFDPAEDICAAVVGPHARAAYDDVAALAAFDAGVEAVTYEFENVPVAAARAVAERRPLAPGVAALEASQDRLTEKTLFRELGITTPAFTAVDSRAELRAAFAALGTPGVLKTRRMGYDGKGQRVLRSAADADDAWAALGGVPLILEGFVPFAREVSCLGVRAAGGETRFYPLVENVHADGILRLSRPRADDPWQAEAEALTGRVLAALDYVGVMAFEFFVTPDGLVANEIAPRVHNSGHWTTEGASCSQFENHLRAVVGWPLGETRLLGPVAMLNLIGHAPDPAAVLGVPGAHLHWYGKEPKPGRKVGHITVTAPDEATLDERLALLDPVARGS